MKTVIDNESGVVCFRDEDGLVINSDVVFNGSLTLNGVPISSVKTYANSTALSSAPNPSPDMGLAQLQSTRALYLFDPNSTLTVDPPNVIAPSSGTGRWIRQPGGHPTWALQNTWYVDSATGNDENEGSATLTALKTFAELRKRIFNQVIAQETTVWIVSNLPNTDPLVFENELQATAFRIRGVRTVLRTGTVTASSVPVASTQSGSFLQDTSFGGTWEANNLVQQIGSSISAWIESDRGNQTARVSYPLTFAVTNSGYSFGLTTFTPGASYQVVTFPTATLGNVTIRSSGGNPSVLPKVVFDGLVINGTNTRSAPDIRTIGADLIVSDCKITTQVATDAFDFANTVFMAGGVFRGGRPAFICGLGRANMDFIASSPQLLGFTSVGGSLTISQGASVVALGLGVFNVSGNAIRVFRGGYLNITTALNNGIYGNGNTGFGLVIDNGSTVAFGANLTKTLTGNSGDVQMQGQTTITSINPTTGSFIGPIALNWANINAAPPAGFGGIVYDIASGCRIVLGS